jgi:Bacteriophage tail sheath protein
MPFYKTPGVYIEEQKGPRTIEAVGTSVVAFVGTAPDAAAHLGEAWPVNNWSQFRTEFAAADNLNSTALSHAVNGFFQNGGARAFIVNVAAGDPISGRDVPGQARTGLKLLEEIDEISIVAAPGCIDAASHEALVSHCEALGDRVCILDLPDVKNTELLKTVETVPVPTTKGKDKDKDTGGAGAPDAAGKSGAAARPRVSPSGFSTAYFPNIVVADALHPNLPPAAVSPSGHIAGIWAATDGTRGVHKAPANVPVAGALNLTYRVTAAEQGDLNEKGINCIRYFSAEGILVWGARTLADPSSEFKYINVRRLLIMIEQSIERNTSWVVFEPNELTTWKSVKGGISGFLRNVWRDGALVGATPEEAFFVKCDEETNPQESIDAGRLVTVIGVAPVKPAEFIIFQIGLTAKGAEVAAL